MVEVRKRERESVESMIRRFTRRIQKSEVLSEARASRFLTKNKSKTKQRLPNKYKLKIKASIK